MNEINYSNSFFENLPEDNTLSFEQKQSRLLSLPIFQPRYIDFHNCCLKGRKIEHLQKSPLADFKEMTHQDWGGHFHGYGKGLVKGANLTFKTKMIDGRSYSELDFKINHVFREALESTIKQIEGLDKHVRRAFLERTSRLGKDISIEKHQLFPLGDSSMGEATKLTVDGLGTIFIGSSSDLPTMYNRIVVQIDQEKTINDFHELLSLFKLETSFEISLVDDQERHKIGHLFRTFYPRAALPLERSKEFFTLSVDELKAKILKLVPEMGEVFQNYLAQMTLKEIFPGRMRYHIQGLAQKAFNLGARSLTAAITGACADTAELFKRVASILKSGLLSSETRISNGFAANGLSPSADFSSGGADSVFTQMITANNCHKNASFENLGYDSDIRLIISLNILESGTYQYLDDSFGNRCIDSWYQTNYSERPSLLEFIKSLQQNHYKSPVPYSHHEVMIKERIDPSFIQKIVVPNSEIRDSLIQYFRECNIIKKGEDGVERILGSSLESFIVAETKMSKTLETV